MSLQEMMKLLIEDCRKREEEIAAEHVRREEEIAAKRAKQGRVETEETES